MTGRCIHCGARVAPPVEVCESCVDLLSDLGEEDELQPAPASDRGPAAPVKHTGRFEPTAEDDRQLLEMELRGAFRPLTQLNVPKARPSHATNKWGRAIEAEKRSRRDPDIPRQ